MQDIKELTDLEICKRIAEIEDILFHVTQYRENNFVALMSTNDFTGTPPELIGEYNPLTDDALCFQLMVKHEVNVDSYLGVTSISSDYTNKLNIAQVSYMDYTINKAICLTIIEANKI